MTLPLLLFTEGQMVLGNVFEGKGQLQQKLLTSY